MTSIPCPRLLQFHCSMPRPPNRRRNSRRRKTSSFTSKPSSSSSSNPSSSNSNYVAVVIDLERLSLSSSNSHLRRLIASADDALTDLRTLVALDDAGRLLVSCRRSTLRFVANSLLFSCVVVLGFRALFWLLFKRTHSFGGGGHVVVRRDRSLGGKEVVVARTPPGPSSSTRRALSSPLSAAKEGVGLVGGTETRVSSREKRLPKWWPSLELDKQNWDSDSSDGIFDKQDYQRDADRLIRAITDNRMSGKDIVADDIIQLRRICRTSGVRVSFDTTNTRDSFYRTAVEFMLNVCGRAPTYSSLIQIDGEDIRQFIAGLAENIGLENTRAARIVSAAVAARTRSLFLQAWALEMQGKHDEAMSELSKICLILRIFPPEESSPEMEMVARGLAKHLKLEQREFLMNMLVGFCDEQSRKIAAEALGLMSSPTYYIGDQQ
ncbi:uncharacterized protein LOC21407430 [Morus notabilis]|uniref:uncharacterized protein LOC21407430 n=1 Tax=Morus notabilis TaxID=981085 RepID=UPI000CED53D6|nr:uncharacterized protein LOC21407430 [Morus notabilis]